MRGSAVAGARGFTRASPKRWRTLYGTDSGEQLAELALHWRLATVSVDRTKAARYAVRAGRQALDSLAPSEAAKLFADALELLGTGDDR